MLMMFKVCFQGGQYIFAMIDFFGGTFIFFVLTTVEVISVLWWYGKNIYEHIFAHFVDFFSQA